MCCDLLGSAGCKIADEDQILHILGGLGSEYDTVMVTVTSKANVWSMQDVGALLLTFDSRLDSSKQLSITSEGSQPSVNIAHSGFQRRDSQSPSNRGNFGGGNRGGNHGFRGGRGGRGGRFSGNKPTCQVCQKPGHTADRCWHRFEQHFQPQAAPRARQPQHQQSYQQQQPFHPAPSANVAQTYAGPSFHNNSSPSPHFPSECSYEGSNVTSWYPDSGATNHVSNDLSNLNSFSEYNGGQCIQLGNGKGIQISHIGQSSYKSHASHSSRTRFLNNLLHAPQITKNLMSVSQFAKDNKVFFEFHPLFCLVKDQSTKAILLKGTLDKGLYRFNLLKASTSRPQSPVLQSPLPKNGCRSSSSSFLASVSHDNPSALFTSSTATASIELWHKRLGHCAYLVVIFLSIQ